jgi:hypothetical protein
MENTDESYIVKREIISEPQASLKVTLLTLSNKATKALSTKVGYIGKSR